MKPFAILTALSLSLSAGSAVAQSTGSQSIRVQPGHFCALNKCVRFSKDLGQVSIQARRPVSVASYGLQNNPVISAATFREIFKLAIVQISVAGNRG